MQGIDWDVVSSYAGLLCLASVSIYCGAFGSLPIRPHERTDPTKSLLQDDEDDEEDIPDRMSSGDAWLFPIVGSLALFGIYAVVTYMGKEWINWFLGWYFSIIGVGSVWKLTVSLAKFVIGREKWRTFDRNQLLLLRGPLEVISLSFRTPTLVLFPLGILPSILYSFSAGSRKSALLTDIFALSFSHNTLSILKLDSFKTGCILLSALFVYDIFWVFFTEVMVKVATSLDVPIKLLWPKSMIFATEKGFTMLGLGDVVIPGLFIALALRYDHARAEKMKTSFTKAYFSVTLTAYVVGLVTTMTVMHMMGKAQPALLYLSPACILSLFVTAVVRGEVDDVWSWSDDPELSPKKAAQEASLVSRALPKVENGNSAPQPGSSADGGHEEAEVTEGDEEEETGEAEEGQEEVKRKKRKSRGKKKA
ncbi:signal peptide peptidase-domain-containing protein [Boletus edulis BED1]|uniref:Signal peptide peptidase-domain-containing protein n=1 Tax=Boletus edulis BED1 TaxID=1328754 RepID=A0AAD4BWU4_BOLED|nr:signal peptide peptidase-domain-containing protein [Boletus edulis BED1]